MEKEKMTLQKVLEKTFVDKRNFEVGCLKMAVSFNLYGEDLGRQVLCEAGNNSILKTVQNSIYIPFVCLSLPDVLVAQKMRKYYNEKREKQTFEQTGCPGALDALRGVSALLKKNNQTSTIFEQLNVFQQKLENLCNMLATLCLS